MIKKTAPIIIILMLLFSCSQEIVDYEYYSTGKIKREVFIRNGEPYKIINYTTEGIISSTYEMTNSMNDGIMTIYSYDGTILGVVNFKDGKKHGKSTSYDEEGCVIFEESYNDGVLAND